MRHNDLVNVRVHYEVRVVSHHDDLAPIARGAKELDEFRIDGLGVQVLLRLIDQERVGLLAIDRQVEQEQNNASEARGQALDTQSVILKAVAKADVLCAVQPPRDVVFPLSNGSWVIASRQALHPEVVAVVRREGVDRPCSIVGVPGCPGFGELALSDSRELAGATEGPLASEVE